MLSAKNKTEAEETACIARGGDEYPHKIQLPELPESWIQYSIEIPPQHLATTISGILMWVLRQSPTA